ncbi:MAG: arsenate reductase ArsC [Candidatus Kapabacteria bacterium]|nr:arsenate reductase ArsC [Candidatus Kapabacteria bacterium]MDW8012795.1 arsenate reductase ArsC [Bacteroidota bacterium]
MRILVLCTHNARRSLMAEALLRWLARGHCEVVSAGIEPGTVDPNTLTVLREIGVPTDGLRSKSVEEFQGQHFDVVLTVCDGARERCPVFPGAPRVMHWSLPDPSLAQGTTEEVLEQFRRVRDELLRRIQQELLPLLAPAADSASCTSRS